MHQAHANREKPLIKIYKDLMVTKRDLIDLRQNIHNTISSIKKSDMQLIKARQRRSALETGRDGSSNSDRKFTCSQCHEEFDSQRKLSEHTQEIHHICSNCQSNFTGSLQDHILYICPETPIICQFCSYQVKKKDLNTHFSVCAFRQCPKCKKEIYLKAYAFHLKECKKKVNKNLISPCKKLPKTKIARPMAIPCCLVVEDYLERP